MAVDKEIAAISTCMKAVDDLELSEALRVIAYVSDFLEVKKLSQHAYDLAREAAAAERRAEGATE